MNGTANSGICPVCGEKAGHVYYSRSGVPVGCPSCVEKRSREDFFRDTGALRRYCPICHGFQPFRVFVRAADGEAVACSNCVSVREA